MRTRMQTLVLILCTSLFGAAQASPSSTAKPAPSENPVAIIHTSVGDMHCTLFPKQAPIGVANFIGLAEGTKDWTNPASHAKKHGVPLYDGTIFHRVIPEFMIQGGDPLGNGAGDPGYKFKNETSSDLKFDRPGRLAYANSGPDTNGSQFFITEAWRTAAPQRPLHHLRPVRRCGRRAGQENRPHGQRPEQRPTLQAGQDHTHRNQAWGRGRSQTRPSKPAAKPAAKKATGT